MRDTTRRARCRAIVLAVGAVLLPHALPTPAAAETFTPPELFIARAVPGVGSRGTNPWVPLAGTRIHSAGVYRLGVRVQATSDSLHRAYLTATWQVPRGRLNGTAAGPCARVQGTTGGIADWGSLSYAGTGPYRIRAGLTAYVSGPCPTGGSTTDDTFAVDARSVTHLVGSPRAHDHGRRGFRGVTTTDPVDTDLPEIVCARSPRVQRDGSLRGSLLTRSELGNGPFREAAAFPTSGRWACVSRAIGAQDIFPPWSAPVVRTIPGLFAPEPTPGDGRPPTFVIRLATDEPGAAGGTVTLPLRSCRRATAGRRVRHLTLRARVDRRGVATFRFRIHERRGEFPTHYVGRALFSGTRLVARGTAPGYFSLYDVHDLFEGHITRLIHERRC